jgi:dTDP-glucose 4,6-dehydratase
MNQVILITGGAGFIGSNFLRLAHATSDYQFVVVDSLTYAGNLSTIEDILSSSRIAFLKGDIRDSQLVSKIFQDYEISDIVHFAAESHVDRSIMNPEDFVQTNIVGTYNLLEGARKAWIKRDRYCFLHISSDEVFGSLDNNDKPFRHNSRYQPNNPYSATKAAADHLVRAWHKTYGLPTIISYCSNNYGPWQFPEKLIPLMILNALEEKEMPLYGEGLQIRDWIHVEDHCRAILAILRKGAAGQTYLVSAHQECTNSDIVHKICDAVDLFNNNLIGFSRKLITKVRDRPGHDFRYASDSSKLRDELNWQPQYRVETALPYMVAWYAQHRQWVKDIESSDYLTYYERQYLHKEC